MITRALLLAALVAAAPAAAQNPLAAHPGDTLGLVVAIPGGGEPGELVEYRVEALGGMRVLTPHAGSIRFAGTAEAVIPLRIAVPAAHGPGVTVAARVILRWQSGAEQQVEARLAILPRPVAAEPAGGSTQLETEVFAAPRVVAPGGMVLLRYTVYSAVETDERVRLRVLAPPGWRVLDAELEREEYPLEALDEINGEIRVAAPPDAPVGARVQLRLVATISGEATGSEGIAQVEVVRRGGLRAGRAGLQGTAYAGSRGIDFEGRQAGSLAGLVELSGRLASQTTLGLSYARGPRYNQAPPLPFASQQADRYTADLRSPGWALSAGSQVYSPGSAITGAGVRAQGVVIRRTQGTLVGEVAAGRPTYFGADPAGHMGRARLAASTRLGTFGVAASEVQRDATALPPTRVQGAGAEAELRSRYQRFTVRAGHLRAETLDSAGLVSAGFSGEAGYAVFHRLLVLNARVRETPDGVRGAQVPGDETSGDVAIRLVGNGWVVGRAARTRVETLGVPYAWQSDLLSGGLRLAGRGGPRAELRATYREFDGYSGIIRRTAQATLGVPVGPVTVDASAEYGHQDHVRGRSEIGSYRGQLRWTGPAGYVSLSGSYEDMAAGGPRRRIDALASVRAGPAELDGGAWASRGPTFGANPGVWATLGIPLGAGFTAVVGGEYMKWTEGTLRLLPPTEPLPPDSVREQPLGRLLTPWRATVGIRRRVVLPLGR